MQAKTVRLSRRERQIVDLLYSLGRATASEIHTGLPDAPSYSAVRATLRILEEKGHVRHEQDGPRYIYTPTVSKESARRGALRHVVQTFFEGSAAQAVSALVDGQGARLSPRELDELAAMIEKARKGGR
jgi:BlaI family penicillinase repressor